MTAHASVHPRRRPGRRFARLATALLVVGLAGIGLVGLDSTGVGAAASTQTAIVGTWRPVSVAGYSGALTAPPLAVAPTLRFERKGKLSGSDGCNYLNGSYRFGRDGTVKFQVSSTKRLCSEPNPPSPLQNAVRIKVRDGRLVFFASGGRELARYARAKPTKTK